MPYVYLGKGKLSNPRETKNEKHTVLFDITLDKSLTDELFEQFNISDDTPRDEGNTADVNVTQNPTDIIKIDFKKIIGASSGNGTHMICTNCKHSDGNSCDLAKVAKATPTECPNFENKES